jgi:copper chaperone CopZ
MTKTLRLVIDGMTCGHCVTAVSDALTKLPSVQVQDVTIGSADVAFDPDQVSVAQLLDGVNDEGYMASAEPGAGV